VENTSSEGNSTGTSAQSSKVDAQATAGQQSNTGTNNDNDTEFFSYSEQVQTTETTESNPKKSAVIKVVGIIILIVLLGLIAFGLWKSYQPQQVELQGRVEAETIHISTKVPSR